jgi:hypothetical protein
LGDATGDALTNQRPTETASIPRCVLPMVDAIDNPSIVTWYSSRLVNNREKSRKFNLTWTSQTANL